MALVLVQQHWQLLFDASSLIILHPSLGADALAPSSREEIHPYCMTGVNYSL